MLYHAKFICILQLDKQEHRLYCVTKELNKTWHLVSKLKVQQDRLHNNEAFLRYVQRGIRTIIVLDNCPKHVLKLVLFAQVRT